MGRFLILDADNEPDWRRLKALAGAMSEEGSASYLELSGSPLFHPREPL